MSQSFSRVINQKHSGHLEKINEYLDDSICSISFEPEDLCYVKTAYNKKIDKSLTDFKSLYSELAYTYGKECDDDQDEDNQ